MPENQTPEKPAKPAACECPRCECGGGTGQFSPKEMFKIALQTRDFEIEMFWKRSNYYLVLNTALATGVIAGLWGSGFFNGEEESNMGMALVFFMFVLSAIGAFVSLAWIKTVLGSKFWQSHWEQVLIGLQEKAGFKESCHEDFFSVKGPKRRVLKNLVAAQRVSGGRKKNKFLRFFLIRFAHFDMYGGKAVLTKPSVSGWMNILACLFLTVWLALAALTVAGMVFKLICQC